VRARSRGVLAAAIVFATLVSHGARSNDVVAADATVPAIEQEPAAKTTPAASSEARATPSPPKRVDGAVPRGIKITVSEDHGGAQVRFEKSGALVALRAGETIASGDSWAALALTAIAPGADPPPLVWEVTELRNHGEPTTTRGFVDLHRDRDGVRATLALAEAPVTRDRLETKTFSCVAFDDGDRGVTTVCRVDAASVFAASLTAAEPRTGIAVAAVGMNRSVKLVRLDAPLRSKHEQSLMFAFKDGIDGIEVRADASWLPGEDEPSFALTSLRRRQPAASFNPGLVPLRR